MTVIPRNNQVLIKCETTRKEVKQGSIILPSEEVSIRYFVSAIGDLVVNLKVGDEVLLKTFHDKVELNKKYGEDLFLVEESVILARVEGV